jgi:hypothetical protein
MLAETQRFRKLRPDRTSLAPSLVGAAIEDFVNGKAVRLWMNELGGLLLFRPPNRRIGLAYLGDRHRPN